MYPKKSFKDKGKNTFCEVIAALPAHWTVWFNKTRTAEQNDIDSWGSPPRFVLQKFKIMNSSQDLKRL